MMSVGQLYVYDEIVMFLTSQPSAQEIVEFELSNAGKMRVQRLVNAKQRGELSDADREELTEFIQVERFLRNIKLRAQRRLNAFSR